MEAEAGEAAEEAAGAADTAFRRSTQMEQFVKEFETLTESERRVFSYIYKNQKKASSMKIQDLAQETLTSKTVIINMCQKLGLEGYGDLKYYLKNRKEEPVQETSPNQMQYQILDQVKKTMAVAGMDALRRAALRILKSRTVYIIARGTSKAVGSYLEHLLLILGIRCIYLKDYNLISTVTRTLDLNETVVVISLSGETEKILEVARIAKSREASVVALTGFFTSSLSKIADETLYCAADNRDTRDNDVHSRLGMFVVVDMLVGCIREYTGRSVFKLD